MYLVCVYARVHLKPSSVDRTSLCVKGVCLQKKPVRMFVLLNYQDVVFVCYEWLIVYLSLLFQREQKAKVCSELK